MPQRALRCVIALHRTTTCLRADSPSSGWLRGELACVATVDRDRGAELPPSEVARRADCVCPGAQTRDRQRAENFPVAAPFVATHERDCRVSLHLGSFSGLVTAVRY
jgi:hypothetical protein